MKPGGIFVNISRGEVVDEAALIAALEQGRIAGAGLDVYAAEPHVPDRLRALDNCVLLPHLGSATVETRQAMGQMALDNIIAFTEGRDPPQRVN
jgi:lactate dehydrogenase-like 2-hydroxyacid dehydrogenase